MLQFGKEQYRHNHHHVKPGGLCGYNRSNTISDECDNNGSNPEYMELRLFNVIVQSQQQSQYSATAHKQAVIHRIKNIKQIPQNTYKSERAVRTEQRCLPFTLQTDFPL